jgi:predicted transcriptional regulator
MKFDRAYLIAILEPKTEPVAAELLALAADMTETKATRELERLVSEGEITRSEHSTYCVECGSDAGVEYRYSPEKRKRCVCGEYWPCTQTGRTDVSPTLSAGHYVVARR